MREKTKRKFRLSLPLKIIIGLIALYFLLGLLSFSLQTVNYTVYTDKVTERVRIAQISDLHACGYGENMKTLIDAVDAAKPDIVVFTGDIYDDVSDNTNTTSVLLKNLGGRYPCYYAAGNHELRTSQWTDFAAEAESYGVHVLEGENADVCGITICGAAQLVDRSIGWEESMTMCADALDGLDKYAVLLYHFPENIDKYRSYGCFDLVLCGHAHGGQWRVPFLINGVFAPSEGLFPKYAGGEYDFDDCTMIVSRGLLRGWYPIARIFNNPELVVTDICPKQ